MLCIHFGGSKSMLGHLDQWLEGIQFQTDFIRSLANSGSDNIQRLNAIGFSVKPMQPPEPFTLEFSCS